MKNKLFIPFILIIILSFFSLSFFLPKKDVVPLDVKIGQMLLVGFTTDDSFDTVIEDVKNQRISGVIFYKRNLMEKDHVKVKIEKIYESSPSLKPFILIDQEGGLVSRLSNIVGEDKYYSAKKVSQKFNSYDEVYNYYFKMASRLKDYGFNFNLAPCVDVAVNENSVLNQKYRIYSADEKIVAQKASAFVKAHFDNKVYSSLKHFPGHGSTVSDSHKKLPDISATWQKRELYPFKKIISENPYVSVMVGHLFNKNIDEERMSSLSKETTDILVKDFNHKGLIILDSIEMSALDDYSCKEIIEYGINANVNLFLFGNHYFKDSNPRKYMSSETFKNIVLELIKEGKISEEQIDNSYKKIKYIKENFI